MSKQQPLFGISIQANADYSTKQYYLMKPNTSGRAVLASVAGEFTFGVLQDDPDRQGAACLVETKGISKVIYGGTVTFGDPLTTDSSGRAVTATKSTDYVIGEAWISGVVNDIGMVFLGIGAGYNQVLTTGSVGTIALPISLARELSSDATMNIVANGGLLASDTTPIYEAVNGATDTKQRINWAASNVDKISWDVALPDDLDGTRDMTLKFWAGMGGATNTPTLTATAFFGVGGSNAGGATAALAATAAERTITLLASAVPDAPAGAGLTVVLNPGAHGTDAVFLYSAKIAYFRR